MSSFPLTNSYFSRWVETTKLLRSFQTFPSQAVPDRHGNHWWVDVYFGLYSTTYCLSKTIEKPRTGDTYYILWTITFVSTTGTHGVDLRCTDGRKTPPPAWFSVEILIKMAADRLLLGKHGGATSACRIGHHGATVEHCMLVVGQRQLVLMASVFRIYWPSWRQFERSKKSEILTTFIWVSTIWAWFWGEGA